MIAPSRMCSCVPDFAPTRLKGGSMKMQRAPAYPEDRAMLICVALAPSPVDRWRARIAGQDVRVAHSIAFATTVIDLMKPMEMWAAGPFDLSTLLCGRAICWTELQ